MRRRLLAAAAREFTERGYADSRLDDIAHAAGFTKGAIYSNFGSKEKLFAAVLGEQADTVMATVMADIRQVSDPAEAAARAAEHVARRLADDGDLGRLGLEFAAYAARDEQTREILAPLRRGQRDAATRSVAHVVDRAGINLTITSELAGLILHCLSNGLKMEHAIDPAAVGADEAEQAIAAVLTGLFALAERG